MTPTQFGGFIAIDQDTKVIVGAGRTIGVARKLAALKLGCDPSSDRIDTVQATERLIKAARSEEAPEWVIAFHTSPTGRSLMADVLELP